MYKLFLTDAENSSVYMVRTGPQKSLIYTSIFKALKVLNLATRSLKVLNFIFVKSSLNIKIIVVFIILNCLWILFFYTSIMSASL